MKLNYAIEIFWFSLEKVWKMFFFECGKNVF